MNCLKMDIFSVKICKENPTCLFVFGDNLIHKGKAGQAVIRDCKNAYGIPTKRLPSMSKDSFFSDTEQEKEIVLQSLNNLLILSENYNVIVFPSNGLGTGLALLKTKSPEILSLINKFIKDNFNITFKE